MQNLTSSNKKFIFTGCFYAFFINGVVSLILGSLLPLISETYGLDYSMGGKLLSAHSIGSLISGFIAGVVPLYLGRKRSIILLSSTSAVGMLGMILTGNPFFLLLSFFLTGIGRGSVSNFDNVLVSETSNGDPKAMNILHSFFAVGAFCAPFLVLFFTRNEPSHWKYAAAFVVGLATIMVVLFSLMKMEETKKAKDEKNNKVKDESPSYDFVKDGHFWVSAGILFFYLCAETAINGWLVTYFKDTGIMGAGFAQTLASLLWLVILVGRLTCAYITKFLSKEKILLVTTTGTAIFFVLLMATQNLAIITVSIVGLGFCMSGIYPTTVANVGEVIKSKPMGMGTLLAISGMGSILMPIITGDVAKAVGIWGGMALITVAVVLALALSVTNYFMTIKAKNI